MKRNETGRAARWPKTCTGDEAGSVIRRTAWGPPGALAAAGARFRPANRNRRSHTRKPLVEAQVSAGPGARGPGDGKREDRGAGAVRFRFGSATRGRFASERTGQRSESCGLCLTVRVRSGSGSGSGRTVPDTCSSGHVTGSVQEPVIWRCACRRGSELRRIRAGSRGATYRARRRRSGSGGARSLAQPDAARCPPAGMPPVPPADTGRTGLRL